MYKVNLNEYKFGWVKEEEQHSRTVLAPDLEVAMRHMKTVEEDIETIVTTIEVDSVDADVVVE